MVSAIVRSACLRPFVRSSVSPAGVVVKAARFAPSPGLPRRRIVGRCSPRSTSFVLAALRALQVDRCCARRDGQRSRIPRVWSGPAAWVVAGLVPDQGVGDLVGAVCHCAADHPALLAAGPQLLAVTPGGRVGMPQPDPKVDQRPPQSHTAFAADAAIPTLPGRLILRRRQTGGTVELAGSRPAIKIPDRGAVVRDPNRAQPGTVVSGANGVSGSS